MEFLFALGLVCQSVASHYSPLSVNIIYPGYEALDSDCEVLLAIFLERANEEDHFFN